MLTNKGLVEYAKAALAQSWGYVWGTFGQVLTEELLRQKIKQYPQGVGGYESIIRSKWMGKKVADCVGLVKGYYWTVDGKFKYDAKTDITADTMLEVAREKGYIGTIPEVPGVLVHRKGHVGIYIGDGYVIEAKGTRYGVVKSKLSAGNWTAWSKCPYINYIEKKEEEFDMKTLVIYFGDLDSLSAILVAQKYQCPMMRKSDYERSGLKAEKVIQVGGMAPNRYESFKEAAKLL